MQNLYRLCPYFTPIHIQNDVKNDVKKHPFFAGFWASHPSRRKPRKRRIVRTREVILSGEIRIVHNVIVRRPVLREVQDSASHIIFATTHCNASLAASAVFFISFTGDDLRLLKRLLWPHRASFKKSVDWKQRQPQKYQIHYSAKSEKSIRRFSF